MRWLGLIIISFACHGSDWHVSPSGSQSNQGSIASPWSISHALTNRAQVLPGDTVLLSGGTYGSGSNVYHCTLIGSSNSPIVVRSAPGHEAIINGNIYGYSGSDHVIFRDFQMTCSSARTNTYANRPAGLVMLGRGMKAINLFINKTGHPGIGGGGSEVYGCVLWGVGTYEYDYITYWPTNPWPRGSALYLQNLEGTYNVENNISGGNINAGMKAYTQEGNVQGFMFKGNCVFHNNGEGIEVEAVDTRVTNAWVYSNLSYRNLKEPMGYFTGAIINHESLVYTNNYVFGSPGSGVAAVWLYRWRSIVFQDNTVITTARSNEWVAGSGIGADGLGGLFVNLFPASNVVSYAISGNRYYGGKEQTGFWYDSGSRYYQTYIPFQYSNAVAVANGTNGRLSYVDWTNTHGFDVGSTYTTNMPTSNTVWLLTNKYELGRANLYVMNWQTNSYQSVDLSTIGLTNGQTYEVRDVQNYAGEPLILTTYNSASPTIQVSLTQTQVDPIGGHGSSFTFNPNTHTAPLFNAFVIKPSFQNPRVIRGPKIRSIRLK